MKLTVFGATGGTGKQLIEQALAEGNDATAYVRNPSKLVAGYQHLTIVQGELHTRQTFKKMPAISN